MPVLPIGTRVGGVASAFRAGQRDAILLRQMRQEAASRRALSDFLTQNPEIFSEVSPEITRIMQDPDISAADRLGLAATFSEIQARAQRRQPLSLREQLGIREEFAKREEERRRQPPSFREQLEIRAEFQEEQRQRDLELLQSLTGQGPQAAVVAPVTPSGEPDVGAAEPVVVQPITPRVPRTPAFSDIARPQQPAQVPLTERLRPQLGLEIPRESILRRVLRLDEPPPAPQRLRELLVPSPIGQ